MATVTRDDADEHGCGSKTVETAAKMSAGDTFEGNLDTKNDEDWIRIELTAGMLYTISLSGAVDGSADTVLKLFDSKGGLIESSNDDIDGAKGISIPNWSSPRKSAASTTSAPAPIPATRSRTTAAPTRLR